MKRISTLFIPSLLLVSFSVIGQMRQKIGNNATNITVSAALEVESTSRGFLPPRMIQSQRNAIVSPVEGLMIYCTNCALGELQFYNGTSWSGIPSFAGGSAPFQSGGEAICDGSTTTAVVELTSSTSKVWMDRNLGASRAGLSSTDYLAYGCLYQWGRGNDGHSSIKWSSSYVGGGVPVNSSTATLASSDVPGNALFITSTANFYDWRTSSNDALWQADSGVNNPCNVGWHVPSMAEYNAEFATYAITDAATAWENGPGGGFRFVLAGGRDNSIARVGDQGVFTFLWSSTVNGHDADTMYIDEYSILPGQTYRAYGYPVRCIKD